MDFNKLAIIPSNELAGSVQPFATCQMRGAIELRKMRGAIELRKIIATLPRFFFDF